MDFPAIERARQAMLRRKRSSEKSVPAAENPNIPPEYSQHRARTDDQEVEITYPVDLDVFCEELTRGVNDKVNAIEAELQQYASECSQLFHEALDFYTEVSEILKVSPADIDEIIKSAEEGEIHQPSPQASMSPCPPSQPDSSKMVHLKSKIEAKKYFRENKAIFEATSSRLGSSSNSPKGASASSGMVEEDMIDQKLLKSVWGSDQNTTDHGNVREHSNRSDQSSPLSCSGPEEKQAFQSTAGGAPLPPPPQDHAIPRTPSAAKPKRGRSCVRKAVGETQAAAAAAPCCSEEAPRSVSAPRGAGGEAGEGGGGEASEGGGARAGRGGRSGSGGGGGGGEVAGEVPASPFSAGQRRELEARAGALLLGPAAGLDPTFAMELLYRPPPPPPPPPPARGTAATGEAPRHQSWHSSSTAKDSSLGGSSVAKAKGEETTRRNSTASAESESTAPGLIGWKETRQEKLKEHENKEEEEDGEEVVVEGGGGEGRVLPGSGAVSVEEYVSSSGSGWDDDDGGGGGGGLPPRFASRSGHGGRSRAASDGSTRRPQGEEEERGGGGGGSSSDEGGWGGALGGALRRSASGAKFVGLAALARRRARAAAAAGGRPLSPAGPRAPP